MRQPGFLTVLLGNPLVFAVASLFLLFALVLFGAGRAELPLLLFAGLTFVVARNHHAHLERWKQFRREEEMVFGRQPVTFGGRLAQIGGAIITLLFCAFGWFFLKGLLEGTGISRDIESGLAWLTPAWLPSFMAQGQATLVSERSRLLEYAAWAALLLAAFLALRWALRRLRAAPAKRSRPRGWNDAVRVVVAAHGADDAAASLAALPGELRELMRKG